MSTENQKELKEVEVLTPEQLEKFPKKVKENILFLSEEIRPKELTVFNPMVSELLSIRSEGEGLKLVPADEEGNFDNENIRDFIDLKNKIRTYRAAVKRTAKAIRDPYIAIQKGIVAIEKTFVNEATKVFDDAEKEFKPYIDEEERIKKEKEDEKNRELLEAARKAEEAAAEQKLKSDRMTVYNQIKYDFIAGKITETSSEVIANGNINSLKNTLNKIKEIQYRDGLLNLDFSILEKEQTIQLQEEFTTAKERAIRMINDRLKALEIERENERLEEELKRSQETVSNDIPLPSNPEGLKRPIQTSSDVSDDIFIEEIKEELMAISKRIQLRISRNENCDPLIYKYNSIINTLIS